MTTSRSDGAAWPVDEVRSNPSNAGSDERVGQLACAIGPEVGMDDRLAILDPPEVSDDRRHDELIVLAPRVRSLDRRPGVRRTLAHPMDDGVVPALDSFPAGVAIHRVVATADRGDRGIRMSDGQPLLQVRDEPERGPRRRVAAVEQGVDAHRRDPLAGGEFDQRHQVAVVGVDAAGSDEADQVERPCRLSSARARCDEGRALEEAAVGDRGIDARQVLQDRAPGAEVQVPDLGVAHLARREPHRVL